MQRFAAIAAAIRLHRALVQKMWDTHPITCRQLHGIGKLLGEKLHDAGLGEIVQLAAADPRDVERITNKVRKVLACTLLQLSVQLALRPVKCVVKLIRSLQVYPWGDQKREDARKLLPPPCKLDVDLQGMCYILPLHVRDVVLLPVYAAPRIHLAAVQCQLVHSVLQT